MKSVKSFALLTLGSGMLLPALAADGAALTVDTTEPTGSSVAIANPHSSFASGNLGPLGERDTFTRVSTAADGGGLGLRGQTFLMPDNPTGASWDLSALTIRADANPDGTGVAQSLSANGPNALTLWVFEWTPDANANDSTSWDAGDGASDGDPFDGTGITNFLVNGESFDITRNFSGEFLHFNTPGVQLAENTAYGLLIGFSSTGTGTRFQTDQIRDNGSATGAPNTVSGESYAAGAFLRSDAGLNDLGSSGDDMVFYVQAAPVPEPTAIAAVGLATLGLLRRRR
jgi:hypothetical protein